MRDERLCCVTEVDLAAFSVVGKRLLAGALVKGELELEVLRELPARTVDGTPVTDSSWKLASRCFLLTLYRTVQACGHFSGLSHVCWHAPSAQRLLEFGLWFLRSHFLKMVPVRLSTVAMRHRP